MGDLYMNVHKSFIHGSQAKYFKCPLTEWINRFDMYVQWSTTQQFKKMNY